MVNHTARMWWWSIVLPPNDDDDDDAVVFPSSWNDASRRRCWVVNFRCEHVCVWVSAIVPQQKRSKFVFGFFFFCYRWKLSTRLEAIFQAFVCGGFFSVGVRKIDKKKWNFVWVSARERWLEGVTLQYPIHQMHTNTHNAEDVVVLPCVTVWLFRVVPLP